MMKALLDTGVWLRRYHGLPMRPALRRFLDQEITEFHLCPLSVAEITFKWRRGRLKGVPNPKQWVPHALENFVLENPSAAAAQQAGQWDWDHGDLVDRVLAAIANEQNLLLVHTDTVLKKLDGFPQKYFPNVSDSK
ncbi:MAG: PIN domain-containing protein [Verrucomicrobia subdivision 3 bacterium]|nr:PIN domain-containing protein [Limisphaerales bacterium]